jgi:hypothetical protein
LLNNVFSANWAGSFSGGVVSGITTADAQPWDMGNVDTPGSLLSPKSSVLQTTQGVQADPTNVVTGTFSFVDPYDVTVNVLASRLYPAFRQAVIVAEILPITLMGNYHLARANVSAGTPASPAFGKGAANLQVQWGGGFNYTVPAPGLDIDGNPRPTPSRPTGKGYDAGSDQLTSTTP